MKFEEQEHESLGTVMRIIEIGDGEHLIAWLRREIDGHMLLEFPEDCPEQVRQGGGRVFYPTRSRAERAAMAYGLELGRKLGRDAPPTRPDRRRLRDGAAAMREPTNYEEMSVEQLQAVRRRLFDGALALQSLDDLGPAANEKAQADEKEPLRAEGIPMLEAAATAGSPESPQRVAEQLTFDLIFEDGRVTFCPLNDLGRLLVQTLLYLREHCETKPPGPVEQIRVAAEEEEVARCFNGNHPRDANGVCKVDGGRS